MLKVVLLGQGYVGSIFAVGLERIKQKELKPYGVPLRDELPVAIEEVELVASYDVDRSKVGKTVYEVAGRYFKGKVPEPLKNVRIFKGIHLGSLKNLPVEAEGLEDSMSLADAVERMVCELQELDADVIVNVCTTEAFKPMESVDELVRCIEEDRRDRITATQAYAYACALYAERRRSAVFVNTIPTLIANDPAFVELARAKNLVIFGDDGATGATPLTADILAHLAQRNRYVKDVVQFNIGGNTDFLALTDAERNKSKEFTKSSVVSDILGYSTQSYIKPTGYLESLGDKKFISMHIEYVTFNAEVDELIVNGRINDSPALAGLIVDLVRLGKMAMDRGLKGTVYEVNAFYMKNPGPADRRNIPRIVAYEKLRRWANLPPMFG